MSYFNELVGGPTNGWRHLANSNTDWGQDLLYLKAWYDDHPEARPLTVAYDVSYVPVSLAGIDAPEPPQAPEPGWHVLSVNQLSHRHGRYDYFRYFEPVDRIGYSMLVYRITPEEANRVRWLFGVAVRHL